MADPPSHRLDAPGAGPSGSWPPRAFPGVDDRLAPPETRLEYLKGIEMFAAPADAPHATQHADLSFVLRAHVRPEYRVAVDLLTRTDHASDFAPDASVFSDELDLETGGRKLEELAFEVCDKQRLRVPTDKARELVKRGVRRVFCIVVPHERVLEWAASADGWQTLHLDGIIDDPTLVRPIPVRALLETATAEDSAARAMIDRKHPAIEQVRQQDRELSLRLGIEQGRHRELLRAILDLARVLALDLSAQQLRGLEAASLTELETVRTQLLVHRTLAI